MGHAVLHNATFRAQKEFVQLLLSNKQMDVNLRTQVSNVVFVWYIQYIWFVCRQSVHLNKRNTQSFVKLPNSSILQFWTNDHEIL